LLFGYTYRVVSQYKVIQDIEAEDKLVGPFSLRQFIYAGIAAVCIYLGVICVSKGAAFMLVVLLPPAIFCAFFAWPWSPDQPTEVWALARIRFYFKPRRRIWDQSGVKELVTITAPKKVEHNFTNGLSQTEVKSRLAALADTIDSRGWVVKNSLVNLSTNQYGAVAADSDRLVSYSNLPQEVSNFDVHASDDILDEQNNPIAQQFDQMIQTSTRTRRAQIQNELRSQGVAPATPQPQPGQNLWFLNQNQPTAAAPSAPAQTDVTPDEEARLTEELKSHHQRQIPPSYSHLKNITPLSQQPAATAQPALPTDTKPTPPAPDPAILNLANNNDLNVATLAREAHKAREPKQPPDDEVVISLH
jgi:hypothetical protein